MIDVVPRFAQKTTVTNGSAPTVRRRLLVRGVVQGVGFRPTVYSLATRLGLTGLVGNDSAGVFIEIEGEPAALDAFQTELVAHPPPLARIEQVTTQPMPPTGAESFSIVASQTQAAANTLISPDLSLCDDCIAELSDPTDRRYRYPFINCTNCGPRFTIVRDIPYDRPLTTMADFTQCPTCAAEYADPTDRRFHAQPNACPDCGPALTWRWATHAQRSPVAALVAAHSQAVEGEAALALAQRTLVAGGIVAIKGIGGFHLACDATNEAAVATLRARKGRADKPFAIMVPDVATARTVATIDDAELPQLTSHARPIVLLRKCPASPLAASVAPGNPCVGVMLPYSPLHHLLFAPQPDTTVTQTAQAATPSLLVMTSGNISQEPIVIDNDDALTRLDHLVDGFLLHDRPIHVPCDDSVVRVVAGEMVPLRRSRGYVPLPITLPDTPGSTMPPLLAVGGELKSTFCLTKGRHAFLSQHIGDMQNLSTLEAFDHAVAHMQTLFRIAPAALVCDLHPGYLSTRWALDHAADGGQTRRVIKVQHHHAHIAAVMAENGHDGRTPVIGFAFDGTGYGSDGAIWGGEVLIADYRTFTRASHLHYCPLPGGDAAIERPYRAALAALWAAGIAWDATLPPVVAAPPVEQQVIHRQCETGLATVPTSSMGRLFDVLAALAGVRQVANYEAQAAIELEGLAAADLPHTDAPDDGTTYRFALPAGFGDPFDAAPLLAAVVADVQANVPPAVIATKVHDAVADVVIALSLWLREETGLNEVALSGGVWQNATLLAQVTRRLCAAGFAVLTHRLVPPNDGGLALGQAMIAGAILAADGTDAAATQ